MRTRDNSKYKMYTYDDGVNQEVRFASSKFYNMSKHGIPGRANKPTAEQAKLMLANLKFHPFTRQFDIPRLHLMPKGIFDRRLVWTEIGKILPEDSRAFRRQDMNIRFLIRYYSLQLILLPVTDLETSLLTVPINEVRLAQYAKNQAIQFLLYSYREQGRPVDVLDPNDRYPAPNDPAWTDPLPPFGQHPAQGLRQRQAVLPMIKAFAKDGALQWFRCPRCGHVLFEGNRALSMQKESQRKGRRREDRQPAPVLGPRVVSSRGAFSRMEQRCFRIPCGFPKQEPDPPSALAVESQARRAREIEKMRSNIEHRLISGNA